MNILDFKRKKDRQEKIAMITCYDFASAAIASQSSVDCLLVGDSVAMVVHGHNNTLNATMPMMVMHTEAVTKGAQGLFVVSDLPFLTHRLSKEHTVAEAGKLLCAGAHAVKIEGGDLDTCNTIAYLVQSGIPVMGHIGLTPQSVNQLGGFKVQGKEIKHAEILMEQAKQLEAHGCFAIVIECVPESLAKSISRDLGIAVIGIGAGRYTDGQVLVWHDILGLQQSMMPRFVKQYANSQELMLKALDQFSDDVRNTAFPTVEHSYS